MSEYKPIKGDYHKMQNMMIALVVKDYFEQQNQDERLQRFIDFCKNNKDPELGTVDFIFNHMNYFNLPFKRDGAEMVPGKFLIKRFFHEIEFNGRIFREESFIGSREAKIGNFLKIAVEFNYLDRILKINEENQ